MRHWKAVEAATYLLPSKEIIEEARKAGFIVIVPNAYTLLLDIDTAAQLEIFNQRINKLEELTPFVFTVAPSPSGGEHKHIKVTMTKSFSDVEKIMLQLFLGSDPIKEFLSLKRVLENDLPATILIRDTDL